MRRHGKKEAPVLSEEDLNAVFETAEELGKPGPGKKEPEKRERGRRGRGSHWGALREKEPEKTGFARESILAQPEKLSKYLGVAFGVFFVGALVFLALSPEETSNAGERGTGSYTEDYLRGLYVDDSENPECPNEFECCNGINHRRKLCPGTQTCRNNECQLRECTSECCVLGRFERKECSPDFVCERYECVLPECPYGCCENEPGYRDKACADNLKCSNNECRLRECNSECCMGKPGFEDKACENNGICVNGTCEKPGCPTRCCLATDQLYQEKKCPSHSRCVGRVCVPNL